MSKSNIKNYIKPIADIAQKSGPLVRLYGGKALDFISKHRGKIGLAVASVIAFDDLRIRTTREQEREQNREKDLLYQEALKKHQAEIDALKTDIEREEYKNRLWEELMSKMEG